MRKVWNDLDFLGVVVSFIYGGLEHFQKLPYGIHQWRQSLNFSISSNFRDGACFLRPTSIPSVILKIQDTS
ncbi:MAG: hypothetical protein ACUVRD_09335 [Bacteroidia bacterium]